MKDEVSREAVLKPPEEREERGERREERGERERERGERREEREAVSVRVC